MCRCPQRTPGETRRLSAFARGFSSFGATRESYIAFLRACRRIGLKCETVIASDNLVRRPELHRGSRPVAVFQDLPADSPRLSLLAHHVVFPAWFHGVPLCFFSRAERGEYPGKSLRSDSLHTDLDAVMAFLLREQLTRILEMCDAQAAWRSDPFQPGSSDSPHAIPLDDDLDQSQAAAAGHGPGPMRVLAPAGSGKTKTLVNRVCNLVNTGVVPERILPLAFNRKAAAEMNVRLEGKHLGRVRARTLHSLGYEIVRSGSRLSFEAGTESALTRKLLKEAFQALHVAGTPTEGDLFERSIELLSAAKMDLLPLGRMTVSLNGAAAPFGPVFTRFLELQKERGFMNYDDMIYFAVLILLDNDAMRRRYQEEYRYILVDEFQDLNRAQILLLQMLALPENNLFVVGDDDQMIYGWRGATVRNIIDFPRIHACARECALSTNYRSSVRIVTHAGWLIGRNRERVPKSVVPRGGAPRGEFEILLHAGLWEQAQSAAEWIMMKKEATSSRWRDTAVLFRYNALQFTVALALDRKNIPHTRLEGSRLFDSRAGRDVAAWLNVLLFPGSAGREDLERILRRPERLLRRSLIERLESWHDLEMLPGTGAMTGQEEGALREFLLRVRTFRLRAPLLSSHELIEELDGMIHLRRSYDRTGVASSDPDQADDGTYLDVISAVSRTFPAAADFLAHIEASRRDPPAPQSMSACPPERPEQDEVVLSTIHRAKGNEFSRVVFFDLSRRHRPGEGEMEEERRVTYVGLTRAKDSLLVTANGRRQSPFLREAALDPQFAGRMWEDMESELRGLRKRIRRLPPPGTGKLSSRRQVRLSQGIDALEEELRCRSMLSLPPAPP
jgi:DNA helicase-2/ATP-dependent DNA helicase PcrA